MESVLDKCLTPTTEMIANLIEIENAHINTNHPDFVGSADSLLNLFSNEQDQDNSNGDQVFQPKSQSYSLLRGNTNGESRGDKGKESGKRFSDIADVIEDPADAQKATDKSGEADGKQGYLSSVFGGYLGAQGGKGKAKEEGKKEEEKPGGGAQDLR